MNIFIIAVLICILYAGTVLTIGRYLANISWQVWENRTTREARRKKGNDILEWLLFPESKRNGAIGDSERFSNQISSHSSSYRACFDRGVPTPSDIERANDEKFHYLLATSLVWPGKIIGNLAILVILGCIYFFVPLHLRFMTGLRKLYI